MKEQRKSHSTTLIGARNRNDKNVDVIEKNLPKGMQVKELYYVPSQQSSKRKYASSSGSRKSTNNSSADKEKDNSDDSDTYGINQQHQHMVESQFKRNSNK